MVFREKTDIRFLPEKSVIFRGCEKTIKKQKDAHGQELQNGAKNSQKRSILEG